jgi:transposase
MAVRGLGCPVRFTLTAGQKGDAPQAAALIEGLPAEVVMADTAYDADHLRQAIAAKGAVDLRFMRVFLKLCVSGSNCVITCVVG